MAYPTPPAKNYQSPLVAIPSFIGREPVEGRAQVPIEILWTTQGQLNPAQAGQYSVYLNLQNNAVMNFSQIQTIKVDNSKCGSDIHFVFTDTGDVVSVAAGDPYGLVPIFSGATQFFAIADNVIATDVTRAQLLNYVPPPVSLDTELSPFSGVTAGNVGGPGLVTIIPATVSGTLNDLQIWLAVSPAPTNMSQGAITVQDGLGTLFINGWPFSAAPNTAPNYMPINLQDIGRRFSNGLQIAVNPISGWAAGGVVWGAYASYRQP